MDQHEWARRVRATARLAVCAALITAVGCDGISVVGGRTAPDAPGVGDVAGDGAASDVADDVADDVALDATGDDALDATGDDALDVAGDAANDAALDADDATADQGPARCMSNADCAGNPAGATCNPATGMCQPPCMGNASCAGNPAGAICDAASGLCTSRCASHGDCAGMGAGDICSPTTRMCTNRCTGNADCAGHPSGPTCNPMTGACVTPCRANADCTGNPAGGICDASSGLCSTTCRSHADCAGMAGTICSPTTRMCAGRCAGNDDCAGHPDGAVCNAATGACVRCVADPDTCPADQHCDPTSNACVSGCRSDEGCPRATLDDGGAGAQLRCNVAAHTCEVCVTDAHCPTGQRCSGGACVAGCTDDTRCAAGERCCGGACVNPQSNAQHCGACGNACRAANGDPGCADGACTIARCTAPFGNCDGTAANGCETNTNTAVAHCGRCGNSCPTRAHATSSCEAGACAFTCAAGFADCNMNADDGCETDLNASAGNCGACGRACAAANGTAACAAGACAVGSCNPGFADCDRNPANGCEVNTGAAVANCGACGRACPAPANGTAACAMGVCGVGTCNAGFADCDRNPANGCEVNLTTAPANCGACGRSCSAANGAAGCAAGACTVASCNAGFGDCDNNPANGCEVNLSVTPSSCGACGRSCSAANGAAGCAAGACTVTACNAGFADCDRNPANGCEVNTRADASNCGACGTRCALPGGTNLCAAGVCVVSTCAAGLGNCDGNPANGCETNTTSSLAHCGACNNACPTPANGTAACARGVCGVAACNAGFADCDGVASNGCEVNTRADVNHCGGCGTRCAARPNTVASCASGACAYACAAGFADCDGNPANGCEVNTATDSTHCGRCRNVCPAATGGGAVCTAGACGQTCPAGQTNCSGTCRATLTDASNCGACGRVCSFANAGATCAAGACAIGACATGFGNCDGNAANGCETNLRTTVANCGTCGRACPAPTGGSATCSNGTCGTSCPAGQTNCANVCRSLLTDTANCGACGRACGASQACSNGVCVGTGQLRFTMTWNVAGDMDLHVVPPCGTEIYYARASACGGTLDADDTSATGPENVFWTSGAAAGAYRVCAVPYSIRGATNFTIQVFRGTTLAQTYTGSRTGSTGNQVCTTAVSSYVGTFNF